VALFGSSMKTRMVTAEEALPGRDTRPYPVPTHHAVLGTPLEGPWPEGTQVLYLAMGCFWGAERTFWRQPGVVTTSVGYTGGFTPNPWYEETVTSRTGHTEAVRVVYDPARVSYADLVATFYEVHDPTQGMRQGNDTGTQYRSAIYYETAEQEKVAHEVTERYQPELAKRGYGPITTEIRPAAETPYYYAEDHHQQYLLKNPFGYRCHANTGVRFPATA